LRKVLFHSTRSPPPSMNCRNVQALKAPLQAM
jgi:hypothetical protein